MIPEVPSGFPDSPSLTAKNYGNTGCRVFKQGVQNWKDFCLKVNIHKGHDWILRFGAMGRCPKVPKCDFQSQFSMSKIIGIFLNSFSYEHIFWNISIFKSLHFLKRCPRFDTFPLHHFSKFNNFLWVCWFVCKNLSNFLHPHKKGNACTVKIGEGSGHW